MKIFVRALVLTLVGTGMYASAQLKVGTPVLHAKVSAYPIPMCPLNDPNHCGVCDLKGGC